MELGIPSRSPLLRPPTNRESPVTANSALRPLQGRRALITGASSGIGAATARTLADLGAHVTIVARRLERLTALRDELGPGRCAVDEADVRDARAMGRLFDGDGFDIVVANAGLALGVDAIQDGDPEDWSTVIDTNVKGVLHTVRAALPGLRRRGKGDLVVLGLSLIHI